MANWLFSVKGIKEKQKEVRENGNTNEGIIELSKLIHNELKRLPERLKKDVRFKEEDFSLGFFDDFEEAIENFKFLTDVVGKEEPEDYFFDSWVDAFDDYLNNLYDIADEIIITKNKEQYKLLWIG